jgi:hypothetical protein
VRLKLLLVFLLIFSLSFGLSRLDAQNQVSVGGDDLKINVGPRNRPCSHSSLTDPSNGCTSDAECQALYGSNSYCYGGSCVLVDTFCPEGYTYDSHTGECVPSGYTTHCPSGYTYDPYSGQCYPQEQWFQYQTKTTKTDTVKAHVTIRSESGEEVQGVGSFQIKVDDSQVGTLTSGQTGDAKVNAGTCYQTYIGSTTGYSQYQGEQCENVVRQHKVEVSVAGPAAIGGDKACPTGVCLYAPNSKDIRYYLESENPQYKGDGETAEFVFKIEYRWTFDTVDQNGNHIDLTQSGNGFIYPGAGGRLASGSTFLKEGETIGLRIPSSVNLPDVVEVVPRDTQFVYDHYMVLDLPSDVGRTFKSGDVVMDGPKVTFQYWQRQYYLTVDGECLTSSGATFICGNPAVSGYYNEAATATYSVDQRVRDNSWMGTFGGYYLFDQWRGDSTSRARTDTIVMNSAKRVTAIYIYVDTDAIRNIAILVAIGVLSPAILIWVITHRGGRRPPPPPPRFPPPFAGPPQPPGFGVPPGTLPPPGGWGTLPPSAGQPTGGWTTTPTPPGTPGPSPAGGPSVGGPGTAGSGTGGPGTGVPGTGGPSTTGPGTGGPGTGGSVAGGPGTGGPGTGGPGTSGHPPTGTGPPEPGTRTAIDVRAQPTGPEVSTAAITAAGVGAAGVGAVALARRRGDKCVWCGSKVKRDQIVCPRCGVHQECQTCGTPLYKASIVSKGYSGNPEDQGLFCSNCNRFTN